MGKSRIDIEVRQTGATKAQSEITSLGKSVSSLVARFGLIGTATAAFYKVGGDILDMSKKIDGVKAAFDRINDATLLDRLRQATRGTISDFELMRRAVQAKNLGVGVENLATLLEFARRRARETGESVDYLADSIVTGIGRKSVMILDNLGLSAARISEEFKKTGDFAKAVGKIVDQEMAGMGADIKGVADAFDILGAKYDNAISTIAQQANDWLFVQMALYGLLNEEMPKAIDNTTASTESFNKENDKTLDILTKISEENQKWREDRLAMIEAQKLEEIRIKNFNHELVIQAGLWRDAIAPELDRIVQKYDKVAKRVDKVAEAQSEMAEFAKESTGLYVQWADKFTATMNDAFVQSLENGKNFFDSMIQGFVQMLERMVAELAARATIFGVFSLLFPGAGTLGTFSEYVFGGFRAGGGQVSPQQSYVVGEQGPELFTPSMTGFITPNTANNTTVNVNIGGNVISSRRWVRDVLVPEIQAAAAGGYA